MNRVVLIGNLTADPVVRETAGGSKVASYTLAVNRRFHSEGQPDTDFIRCTVFARGAEFAEKHLKKGTRIAIEGRIQTGSYEKDGQRHYTTDVVVESHEFVTPRSAQASEAPSAPAAAAAPAEPADGFVEAGVDEELPFN